MGDGGDDADPHMFLDRGSTADTHLGAAPASVTVTIPSCDRPADGATTSSAGRPQARVLLSSQRCASIGGGPVTDEDVVIEPLPCSHRRGIRGAYCAHSRPT